MKKIRKAVIPAAGYGTRFLPATKTLAKEMLPIIDTPTIQFIVEEGIKSGIEEFLIIVSANKNSIVDHFDRNLELETMLESKNKTAELNLIRNIANMANVHFVRQKEQLGLGHAVLCAKTFVGDEPFALLLGDDIYVGREKPVLLQLIDIYDEVGCSILGTLSVPEEEVSKYGICQFVNPNEAGTLHKLSDVVEKPKKEEAPSTNAIGGRYILTPTIFKFLETQTPGALGEIQLTDSIRRMMQEEEVYSQEIAGKRYDIGSKLGFIEAIIDFALERNDLKDSVKTLLKEKLK